MLHLILIILVLIYIIILVILVYLRIKYNRSRSSKGLDLGKSNQSSSIEFSEKDLPCPDDSKEPIREKSNRPLGTGSYIRDLPCGGFGWSCFPAGTMILMGDYTEKPIEEILIGELVITPFGQAKVKMCDRPLLGNRLLYEMQNGRKLRISAEHSIWGRNPKTQEEWWTTRDIKQWRYEAEMGIGSNYWPDPVDLKDLDGGNWEFATVNGWNKTVWKQIDASEDTQLYDLILDCGGAYFADGYMVKALYDSPNIKWNQYKHKPVFYKIFQSNSVCLH